MGKWLYIFVFISSLSCLLWGYTDNPKMSFPPDTEIPNSLTAEYEQTHLSASIPDTITCTITEEANIQFQQFRNTSSKWKNNTHFFCIHLIYNSPFTTKEQSQQNKICLPNLYSQGYIYFTQKLLL